jgi:hypothetical protein
MVVEPLCEIFAFGALSTLISTYCPSSAYSTIVST